MTTPARRTTVPTPTPTRTTAGGRPLGRFIRSSASRCARRRRLARGILRHGSWWRSLSRVNLVRLLLAVAVSFTASDAIAHRSGCHRWHSCPSDHGTYVCGDLGHCSGCPDNQYCLAGQAQVAQGEPRGSKPENQRPGVPAKDAWTCPSEAPIKGNFTTYSGSAASITRLVDSSTARPSRSDATRRRTRQGGTGAARPSGECPNRATVSVS